MPITLRDYQADLIERGRAALRRTPRVLLQAPTGAGKTALASFMVGESAGRGSLAYFICHRAELVEQTSRTFDKFGIRHGFIAAGRQLDIERQAQIASIDTLKNRVALLQPPKLALWDECHHMGAAGWSAVMAAWPNTYHIGLSATPTRLDGQGLGAYFGELVLGPSVAWLIEQGHLSDYRIFAPPPPAELKARGMNDGTGEQAKVMDRPKLVGDIVGHWLRHANGLRTVGFACNIEHSQHMVAAFNAAGIPAAHLDGNTPKGERAKIIQDYAAGRIRVLWNVSLFGEGFDLAAIAQCDVTIDCVILARQTQSLGLYLQMVGRALRPGPGKVAVILDHAGNAQRHGFPDDEREWTLEGREKGRKAANDDGPPPPYSCVQCFMQIKRPLPTHCPHCGAPIIKTAREIEVAADIELQELTREEKRRAKWDRLREEDEACRQGLGALVALGQRRGYPSPQQWGFRRLAAFRAKHQKAA